MELGNLHGDVRLLLRLPIKDAGNQREMYNRFTLETKYRGIMQGQTNS
jgi:hypothetical protein